MDTVSGEFRFKIGDYVYLTVAVQVGSSVAQCYQIAARIVEECHGGLQRHYKLVGHSELIPEFAVSSLDPADTPYEVRLVYRTKKDKEEVRGPDESTT